MCRMGSTSISRAGRPTICFGTGRTALKASVGRYVGQMNANVAAANNPIITSVNPVTRPWTDTNRNFVPDCDLGNFGGMRVRADLDRISARTIPSRLAMPTMLCGDSAFATTCGISSPRCSINSVRTPL